MSEDLGSKYVQYKTLLYQRHLDSGTWVLNRDLQKNQFADFGKGDSLFYTTILLAALALENNKPDYLTLLKSLNEQSFSPGMYPRYRDMFDTSKDPYHTFILALLYGMASFPGNLYIRQTLSGLVDGVRKHDYHLVNPDGSKTLNGDMSGLKPVFGRIEGSTSPGYFLSLLVFPAYSFLLNLFRRSYFNNFMIANEYLMLESCTPVGIPRWCLKGSVRMFSLVNRDNPYALMLRDIVAGSGKHEPQVRAILQTFPGTHLPNEGDRVTNSDVLWQIDPRDWQTPNSQCVYEFAGVDFLILYRLYVKHYS